MAIHFREDLDSLISLLEIGGYSVHTVEKIPGSRGRTADLHLENGSVVSWDVSSRRIWVDRSSENVRKLESFLERMCEGTRVLRPFAILQAQMHNRSQGFQRALAARSQRKQKI